ncbi:MAG: flagellin [Alteromonadaceae bacterium]|mgnify:CR=1 FL=1|jgi:flagellin|nr:flagellin [Alteromonadaceae bacterium]|tara:strand:+ start:442 stop:1653 length:1212 start_codon:yes stop_codon:yes gene_type:complete
MGLFVNTNVAALEAQRHLFDSSNRISTALEQLSSGFRINRASDDAAGLQITDRLTSQIQGLNQAVRNANDGISLVQTAEGALTETTSSLQRIRQLAVQAQSGINSNSDKAALNKEVTQLLNVINTIADNTQFAGKSLLNGTFSASFLVGANSNQNIDVSLTHFSSGFGIAGLGVQGLNITTGVAGAQVSSDDVNSASAFGSSDVVYNFLTNPVNLDGEYNFSVSNDGGNTYTEITVDMLAGSTNYLANEYGLINAVNSALGEEVLMNNIDPPTLNGSQADFRIAADTNNPSALTEPANSGTVGTYDGSLVGAATGALTVIDGAISRINGVRAELGATQNRFQSTVRNLSTIAENVTAARSQVNDTDYATATAELTKHQIIQQASASVLSQANQLPQAALTLLG